MKRVCIINTPRASSLLISTLQLLLNMLRSCGREDDITPTKLKL